MIFLHIFHIKVAANLEIDSRPVLSAHSQVFPTLQTTSASCIDWKICPRTDNFWLIWVGIPIMRTCTHLKARSLENLMDVSFFTKMVLCPSAGTINTCKHDRDGANLMGKLCFLFHPDTGAHDEHVITVREELILRNCIFCVVCG